MERVWWAIHNMVGHPLMGALDILGLHGLATVVHDRTLPPSER